METATITGAGAVWNPYSVDVGTDHGAGTVVVSNGGNVSSRVVFLGSQSDADNSATVTGRGSAWTTADIYIGYANSRGKLIVSDGGTFTATDTFKLDFSKTARRSLSVAIPPIRRRQRPRDLLMREECSIFRIRGNSLNFNHTDNSRNYEFTPGLSGGGSLNFYNGATVLTANSSRFTGPTNVREKGTLIVKGSLTGSDVAVWGVLGGNGKVNSVTIQPGGKIEPGNSAGTLHIGGNLHGAKLQYHVEINGDQRPDQGVRQREYPKFDLQDRP